MRENMTIELFAADKSDPPIKGAAQSALHKWVYHSAVINWEIDDFRGETNLFTQEI
jgi:hypothetical protein